MSSVRDLIVCDMYVEQGTTSYSLLYDELRYRSGR